MSLQQAAAIARYTVTQGLGKASDRLWSDHMVQARNSTAQVSSDIQLGPQVLWFCPKTKTLHKKQQE